MRRNTRILANAATGKSCRQGADFLLQLRIVDQRTVGDITETGEHGGADLIRQNAD